jgi:hypothetical protein
VVRINTLCGGAFEPGHLAVSLFGQPILKWSRTCGHIGRREPAIVKSQFHCPLSDLFFHGLNQIALIKGWRRPLACSRALLAGRPSYFLGQGVFQKWNPVMGRFGLRRQAERDAALAQPWLSTQKRCRRCALPAQSKSCRRFHVASSPGI